MSSIFKGALMAGVSLASAIRGTLVDAVLRGQFGPRLLLNFLSGTLDPRITFSRGSNATRVDATGKITYAPANLLLHSQNLSLSPWGLDTSGGSLPIVTPNFATAPDGTSTATRVQLDRGVGTYSRLQQTTAPPVGLYIASVWMKTTSGVGVSNVGLRNEATGINCVVTGSWQRFFVATPSPVTTPSVQILLFSSIPGNDVTADILVWGAQLEPVTYQTTPSTYVATTASAYYGPRFDYDPVTLAAKGLLIEEARTNLALYSAQFGDAAWLKSVTTVTENTTVSPDGTANADTHAATASGAGAARQVYQIGKTLTAIPYTWSVYAKAKELNWLVINAFDGTNRATYFNLANGTVGTVAAGDTATIQNAGNGWYRCFVTRTAAATVNGGVSFELTTGDNVLPINANLTAGSGIYLYGAQLEAGSFATSYIPTVASTVTRSADVATMTGTNFSSWYNPVEGTFVFEGTVLGATGFSWPLVASDNTAANRLAMYRSGASVAGFIATSSATQMEVTSSPVVANVPFKIGVAAQTNSGNFSFNGNIGTNDTTITMPVVNRLSLGASASGSAEYLNGHIRSIRYYPTRLPNTQLQSLTA